jgi:hypothetical protein
MHITAIVALGILSQSSFAAEKHLLSPDRAFEAIVFSTGPGTAENGNAESRFEIRTATGELRLSKSFASPDGEHGASIIQEDWTPDSRFPFHAEPATTNSNRGDLKRMARQGIRLAIPLTGRQSGED